MTTNPDDRFGWTRFYMEFANKLLEHRDDRSLLVAKVREVCNNRGYRYLDNSGTAEEDAGLTDICPFTVMGSFNRGISDTNRNGIAAELGEFEMERDSRLAEDTGSREIELGGTSDPLGLENIPDTIPFE